MRAEKTIWILRTCVLSLCRCFLDSRRKNSERPVTCFHVSWWRVGEREKGDRNFLKLQKKKVANCSKKRPISSEKDYQWRSTATDAEFWKNLTSSRLPKSTLQNTYSTIYIQSRILTGGLKSEVTGWRGCFIERPFFYAVLLPSDQVQLPQDHDFTTTCHSVTDRASEETCYNQANLTENAVDKQLQHNT